MREGKTGKSIVVRDGKCQRCVDLEDISYISIVRHGCKVHMPGESGWVLSKSLEEIYRQIRDYDFVYAHSSYIVNLWHIASVDENEELLTLDTGEKLGISRSRRSGLRQQWIRTQEEKNARRKKREQDYYKLEELHQRYSNTLEELERDVKIIYRLVERFGGMQKTLEELGATAENCSQGEYTKYFRINMILDVYKEKAAEQAIPMEIEVSREFSLSEEVRPAAAVMLDSMLEYSLLSTERCLYPSIHVVMKRNRRENCAMIIIESSYDGKMIIESISDIRAKIEGFSDCLELFCKGKKIKAVINFPL